MPDKPKTTIREQWQEYRKTACEWCAAGLDNYASANVHYEGELLIENIRHCTAMPFESWAKWKIRHFTDVLRSLRTEQLGPEEWGIKCIQDRNDIIAEALAAQPESGVKEPQP